MKKSSILIVDDEFGLADVVSEILTESGYEVSLAINGKLGLVTLAEKPVDLVLLDLMMPLMDGAEMLQRMRADSKFKDIPVVMMTALPGALTREVSGYQGLLRKPFTVEQLFELIRPLLKP